MATSMPNLQNMLSPVQSGVTAGNSAGAIPHSTIGDPNAVAASVNPGANPLGVSPIGTHGFTSLYGNDSGNAVAQLFNSMNPGTASYFGQQIINANQPNVAMGQANLNTQLAASGIGPSSSVSAIENANYMSGVQQENLSTLAKFGLNEQQMQMAFLLGLLPGQQQREKESSGWSIFNDIMQGIGTVSDTFSSIPGL